MKIKFRNLCPLVVLIQLGCSTPNLQSDSIRFTEKDLPAPVLLKGHKFDFPQIINPRGILVTDSKAIVFERKNVQNDKFHIIDLVSESYVQSKGIDGLGPGEISVITQIEELDEPNKILTFDPEVRLFSKFDLLDTNRLAEYQFRSPETAFFITRATFTSDSSFLGNAVDGWTKYLHLTISGDTLALFGDWKDMIRGQELPNGIKEEEMDANLVSSVFQGILKLNLDKSYAVKVGTKANYIDIIRLKDHLITTIFGPRKVVPDFQIGYWGGYQMPSLNPNSPTIYGDVYAGKASFFVLFKGKPYSQMSDMTNLNRIFEFDYKGKILNQYQLDYPLFGFSIDENDRKIYGVTTDEEPNLVRFDY